MTLTKAARDRTALEPASAELGCLEPAPAWRGWLARPAMRGAPARLLGAFVAAAALLGALAGCTGRGDGLDRQPPGMSAAVPSPCRPGDDVVVDPVLLAFLSRARSAHRVADLAERGGDRAAAVAALDDLVSGPKPPGSPPELREVEADSRARLADLRSADGDFDGAIRELEAGVSLLSREPTHFRGRLFEVRGLVEERRTAALARLADDEGAERARRAALDAFQEAIDIQAEVIRRALDSADGGAPAGSSP